jgi:hypothetical protein
LTGLLYFWPLVLSLYCARIRIHVFSVGPLLFLVLTRSCSSIALVFVTPLELCVEGAMTFAEPPEMPRGTWWLGRSNICRSLLTHSLTHSCVIELLEWLHAHEGRAEPLWNLSFSAFGNRWFAVLRSLEYLLTLTHPVAYQEGEQSVTLMHMKTFQNCFGICGFRINKSWRIISSKCLALLASTRSQTAVSLKFVLLLAGMYR